MTNHHPAKHGDYSLDALLDPPPAKLTAFYAEANASQDALQLNPHHLAGIYRSTDDLGHPVSGDGLAWTLAHTDFIAPSTDRIHRASIYASIDGPGFTTTTEEA